MMEVGPWRMDGKDSLKLKDGGLEEYANVLYCAWSSISPKRLSNVVFI